MYLWPSYICYIFAPVLGDQWWNYLSKEYFSLDMTTCNIFIPFIAVLGSSTSSLKYFVENTRNVKRKLMTVINFLVSWVLWSFNILLLSVMECRERAGSLVWLSNEHDKWTAADWALCATLHIYGRVVYWLLCRWSLIYWRQFWVIRQLCIYLATTRHICRSEFKLNWRKPHIQKFRENVCQLEFFVVRNKKGRFYCRCIGTFLTLHNCFLKEFTKISQAFELWVQVSV